MTWRFEEKGGRVANILFGLWSDSDIMKETLLDLC